MRTLFALEAIAFLGLVIHSNVFVDCKYRLSAFHDGGLSLDQIRQESSRLSSYCAEHRMSFRNY